MGVTELVEKDLECNDDTSESSRKSNSAAMKLERRRRIEELHEERYLRDDWMD